MTSVREPSASKQRILSNLVVMGSGQLVTWLISTLYLVLISRYLGPTLQGQLSRAGYAILLFSLVLSLGMEGYLTRAVARTPERAGELTTAIIIVRAALLIPIFAGLLLYINLTHLGAQARVITYILFLGMVIGTLAGPLTAALMGREQMGLSTAGAVFQNVFELILVGLVLLLHGGVVVFAATNVLMSLSLLLLNLYWTRNSIRLTRHTSIGVLWEVTKGGLGFWIGGVLYNFYLYIDAAILGYYAGDTAVGIYAPATRMFAVPLFLPGIIAGATLPLLSRLGLGGQQDFARVARKTLALLIITSVPLAIGTATFARPLILTIFGRKYADSVPVLQVLSLCIPSTFLAIQFYQMVVARDQQWRWNIIMAIGCVVNPLLNLLLISYAVYHWHNGALGAAWTLVATEGLMMVYGVAILRDVVLHRELARALGSALAAGAAQGMVLFATRTLWAPLGEALGVAAYIAVIFALGALPREELVLLWRTGLNQGRKLYARTRVRPAIGTMPPESLNGS